MLEMRCDHCGAVRLRTTGEVNRSRREGRPLYCSRECGYAARSAKKKESAWHKRRFVERPNAIHVLCEECGRSMWLPPSKADEYKRCSSECNRAWREREKKVVVVKGKRVPLERPCETCGTTFRPRPNLVRKGQGRYCSQKCNPADHLTTPEALALAQQRKREGFAAGTTKLPSGPANKQWMGGPRAARARRIESGKEAESIRRYRAKNPEKVREWAQNRRHKKLGRLPYGTIPRIGSSQRWKCAICRKGIKDSYHVDHIMPIAKGGKHEARNIQLLCASCNVRKSAKDPIRYMQELGRLL